MVWKTCKNCGVQFKGNGKHYCTWACFCAAAGRHKPDAATLQRLVWEQPTRKLAEQYEISDVALAKWCRKAGIKKPPRGYWAKMQAGKLKSVLIRDAGQRCRSCQHLLVHSVDTTAGTFTAVCWEGKEVPEPACKLWDPSVKEKSSMIDKTKYKRLRKFVAQEVRLQKEEGPLVAITRGHMQMMLSSFPLSRDELNIAWPHLVNDLGLVDDGSGTDTWTVPEQVGKWRDILLSTAKDTEK